MSCGLAEKDKRKCPLPAGPILSPGTVITPVSRTNLLAKSSPLELGNKILGKR